MAAALVSLPAYSRGPEPTAQEEADNLFAVRVVDYSPAPGQFVNHADFNDPTRAVGSPDGAGLTDGNSTSVVTLGGFGGSITLAFNRMVEDHALNPMGLDAIVFGNAFFVGGDPQRRWAEAATIEISLDVNGNGVADDPWYLIPGSHIVDPAAQLLVVEWDAGDLNAAWIPPGKCGVWTTQGYALPLDPFGDPVVENPAPAPGVEGIFGYGDYSPTLRLGDLTADNVVDDPTITPEEFYTVPDGPFTVGITPGSGGGDAFDIAWAIDPVTAERANLPGFHFIRITTAVHQVNAQLNETSAEIDAVAAVRPDLFGDLNDDGDIDLWDVALFDRCFGQPVPPELPCSRAAREPDGVVDFSDAAAMYRRLTGPTKEPITNYK